MNKGLQSKKAHLDLYPSFKGDFLQEQKIPFKSQGWSSATHSLTTCE